MKKLAHDAFEIGITIKFIDGILEIIGTGLILLIPPASLASWFQRITEHDLDFLKFSQGFAAFYLFSHGIVKIFIVICLWQKKLWAYPLAIVFFVLFGIYQTYQYFLTHSILMLVLTILDIAIIWLTWVEYQNLKVNVHARSG